MSPIQFVATTISLALFWTNAAAAQDVQIDRKSKETIAKCLQAMGSEMALNAVDRVHATGTMSMRGRSGSIALEIKSVDEKFWMDFRDIDMDFTNVFNGKYRWHINKGKIGNSKEDGYRYAFPYPSQVLRWQERCESVKHIGETSFHGTDVVELQFKPTGFAPLQRYFDKNSGLLIGQKMTFNGHETDVKYEYTEIDGIQFVNRLALNGEHFPNVVFRLDYKRDVEIDESIFDVPESVKRSVDLGETSR